MGETAEQGAQKQANSRLIAGNTAHLTNKRRLCSQQGGAFVMEGDQTLCAEQYAMQIYRRKLAHLLLRLAMFVVILCIVTTAYAHFYPSHLLLSARSWSSLYTTAVVAQTIVWVLLRWGPKPERPDMAAQETKVQQ